jgi:endonuclease/exonuclease/phosphatase family metal-dependent hydrolase
MEQRAASAFQTPLAASAFDPIVVNRPARAPRPALKVVAFNAHGGGRHFDGVLKCLRRAPLADADVILLSEADWGLRRSAGREIASELAAELDMSFAYLGEFGFRRGESDIYAFGNAILSSHPLADVRGVPLPNVHLKWRIRRLVGAPAGLTATITVNHRRITVGVVHMNSRWHPEGRAHQMAEFLAALPSEGPALIGGDWNTTTLDLGTPTALLTEGWRFLLQPARLRTPERYEPLFDRLAQAGFDVRGVNVPRKPTFTFSRVIPPILRPKLDWIAHRELSPVPNTAAIIRAQPSLLSARVSDHDFVTCEVRL